jgi:hypothetical protein
MSKQLVKSKEFSFASERRRCRQGCEEKEKQIIVRGNRTPLLKINISFSVDVCMANLFIYDQFM